VRDDVGHDVVVSGPVVAVVIPCFNEEQTIGTVVSSFRQSLPGASIYVYDNNSTDASAELALRGGAEVRGVGEQGKGHVVRRAFADIEADVYVLVDGDDTYDASAAAALVAQLGREGLDLVNGARRPTSGHARRGHEFGNRVLTRMIERLFKRPTSDILSGYKVFSRRFVKSFPSFSSGFEIETELTVHALGLAMPIASVDLTYRDRPEGSESKLHTFGDGLRILRTINGLLRRERPLAYFGVLAALLGLAAVVLGIPVVATFVHSHKVPRLPTAVLATGLMVLASLSLFTGLILDTVTRGRKEAKMLSYLSIPGPLG
jgi:glycosyltransferase involved in cell wall biosynthesis